MCMCRTHPLALIDHKAALHGGAVEASLLVGRAAGARDLLLVLPVAIEAGRLVPDLPDALHGWRPALGLPVLEKLRLEVGEFVVGLVQRRDGVVLTITAWAATEGVVKGARARRLEVERRWHDPLLLGPLGVGEAAVVVHTTRSRLDGAARRAARQRATHSHVRLALGRLVGERPVGGRVEAVRNGLVRVGLRAKVVHPLRLRLDVDGLVAAGEIADAAQRREPALCRLVGVCTAAVVVLDPAAEVAQPETARPLAGVAAPAFAAWPTVRMHFWDPAVGGRGGGNNTLGAGQPLHG